MQSVRKCKKVVCNKENTVIPHLRRIVGGRVSYESSETTELV